MPAPKKMTEVPAQRIRGSELGDVLKEGDTPIFPDDGFATEIVTTAELVDVLRWVGRVIIARNANGKQGDKFCRLCAQSRLLHEPCRHAEVWKLSGVAPAR